MSINQWRIYCNTEAKWVEGWIPNESGPPTVCFNNNEHIVNQLSQQQLTSTQLVNTKIIQEITPTGGHYACQGFTLNILPTSTNTLSVSWPFPVTTLNVHIQSTSNNIGDVINAIISPYTVIGYITASIPIGSTNTVVSTTVLANTEIGYNFYIDSEDLGRVVGINTTTSTITFENATTILHNTNALVYVELQIIRNFQLGYNNGNDLGLSSLCGKSLDTRTITNVNYTNNSSSAKKFAFSIEYLF